MHSQWCVALSLLMGSGTLHALCVPPQDAGAAVAAADYSDNALQSKLQQQMAVSSLEESTAKQAHTTAKSKAQMESETERQKNAQTRDGRIERATADAKKAEDALRDALQEKLSDLQTQEKEAFTKGLEKKDMLQKDFLRKQKSALNGINLARETADMRSANGNYDGAQKELDWAKKVAHEEAAKAKVDSDKQQEQEQKNADDAVAKIKEETKKIEAENKAQVTKLKQDLENEIATAKADFAKNEQTATKQYEEKLKTADDAHKKAMINVKKIQDDAHKARDDAVKFRAERHKLEEDSKMRQYKEAQDKKAKQQAAVTQESWKTYNYHSAASSGGANGPVKEVYGYSSAASHTQQTTQASNNAYQKAATAAHTAYSKAASHASKDPASLIPQIAPVANPLHVNPNAAASAQSITASFNAATQSFLPPATQQVSAARQVSATPPGGVASSILAVPTGGAAAAVACAPPVAAVAPTAAASAPAPANTAAATNTGPNLGAQAAETGCFSDACKLWGELKQKVGIKAGAAMQATAVAHEASMVQT